MDSREKERENERERQDPVVPGGGRECTWQIPVCWRKGRRCTGRLIRALAPRFITIRDYLPVISGSVGARYESTIATLLCYQLSPFLPQNRFRNRRRFNDVAAPFWSSFFLFLSNIRSLLSNDLIIRPGNQSSSFSKYFCSLIRATVQYATIDVNHDCVYCSPHKRRDKIFLYTNVPREYIYNFLCNFTFFL